MKALLNAINNLFRNDDVEYQMVIRRMEVSIASALAWQDCDEADELYDVAAKLGLPISNTRIENTRIKYERILS